MTENWDELQELVKAEMQKIYSETIIDHAMNPRNVGSMENAGCVSAREILDGIEFLRCVLNSSDYLQ